MTEGSALQRIPVVGGLGYVERVRRLPSSFVATLVADPAQRYFRHAVAVMAQTGAKVGYVAPEVAVRYHGPISRSAEPVTCPARRASASDLASSGVELLLDFSGLSVSPEP